mgnify:FL=1
MTMDADNERQEALGPPVQRPVGRLAPEREDIDYDDLLECPRCHGDGMDPWNDYALPCPECGGRDAP